MPKPPEIVTWQNISRLAGIAILIVELRQVLLGLVVDSGMLVLAGGLLGLASAFRRNGQA